MLSVEELNDRLIDLSFAEDIGDGDHTTLCCIPDTEMGESKLLIKEEGIFAGVEIAKQVRYCYERKGQGAESPTDRASYAEHLTTYERHCHHDAQVSAGTHRCRY